MARLLARRLIATALLVAFASAAALVLTRLAPGDMTADLGPFASAREVASMRARYGIDQSPLAQLGRWAAGVLRLDFGESFLYSRPVLPLVARAALNTSVLALASLAAATCLGLGLGIVSGSGSGPVRALIRGASLVCLSLPPLVTSLLLVFVAVRTGWFPAGGMTSVEAAGMSWAGWAADLARHLPVPVIALALPLAARFERLQSQAIADAMRQPFVTAAAARGLSRRDLVMRHAWRASLPPICGVYGIAVGALLSGSFVVEYITAWPGLGQLMYTALSARDVYLVAGGVMMGAALLALGTLIGDVLLAAVDPRARGAA